LTANGTANSANSEPNLTFNPSINLLTVNGSATIYNSFSTLITTGSYGLNSSPNSILTSNLANYGERMVAGSTSSTTAGLVYYLNPGGFWSATDADGTSTSTGLIAIAIGSSSASGMLIRGFFRNNSWSFIGGLPVYLSVTTGALSQTAPTGSGDVVRIVGHALGANIIHFNPSSTWIVIA
jgi:hypothetical protein